MKPGKVNMKMEKELIKYKKEIEDKYQKSQIKKFVFKRTKREESEERSGERSLRRSRKNLLPELSSSMQRNIIKNKIDEENPRGFESNQILPTFVRTNRFEKLQKLSKRK